WSILSIIFILLTRPFVKKYIDNNKEIEAKTILKIEKKIDNKTYEVRYKGGIWTAVSTEELSVGDEVEMDGFTGNKIIVKK
ncbi:MAG: NfeD family protein, partial [Leptotrichiaceae bacterium]